MHPLIWIFERFGFPKWFWHTFCHKKAGQVEPFLSEVCSKQNDFKIHCSFVSTKFWSSVNDCIEFLFQMYPFDKNECSFGIRPLFDTKLRLNLLNLTFSNRNTGAEYFKSEISRSSKSSIVLKNSKFSFIGYNISIKRIWTCFIVSHYIPVTLYTWASFSSFDLRQGVNCDRIGFLVTLFLVLANMMITQTNSSPGGNMVTSIGNYYV